MDPTVSLSKLSTSIVQLSARVMKFAADVSDAQQDMDDLSEKLESLEGYIETLEGEFENPAVQYPNRQKKHLKTLVEDCDRITKEMNGLLTSLASSRNLDDLSWTALPKGMMAKLQHAMEDDITAIVLTMGMKKAVIPDQIDRDLNSAHNQDRESMISISQSFRETANIPYSRDDPFVKPGEVPREVPEMKPSLDSKHTSKSNGCIATDVETHDRRNASINGPVFSESPMEVRGAGHQSISMRPDTNPEPSQTTPAKTQSATSTHLWLESQFSRHETPSIRYPSETALNSGRQNSDDWTHRQLLPDDRPFEKRHEGNSDKEVVPSNFSIRSQQTLASMSEASVRELPPSQLERGKLDDINIVAATKTRGRLSDSEREKQDKELLKRVKDGAELSKIESSLDRGADPNAAGPRNTVLTTEIQYTGRQQVIELLLRRGAEPNATSDGVPKYKIIEGGNMERLRSKIGGGGSIDAVPNRVGVLFLAALHTNIEIVKLLMSYGAALRPLPDLMNTLSRSFSPGQKESKRPSVDRINSSGMQTGAHRSAILVAAEKEKWDIVQFLALHGADPNESCGKHGSTLQLATAKNRREIMQLLISRGADVNVQGGPYGSALIAAAYEGYLNAAKLLLDAGANINYIHMNNQDLGTALNAAVLKGYLKVVKLLLDGGAEPRLCYVLDTALKMSKDDPEDNTRKSIVRLLEARGAKPGPSDRKVATWAGLFADVY